MSTILIAVLAIAVLAAVFGAILGFVSIRFKAEADPIVDQIDAILPQPNAVNVATQAVVLTQKRLPMVTKSINALRAVSKRSKN